MRLTGSWSALLVAALLATVACAGGPRDGGRSGDSEERGSDRGSDGGPSEDEARWKVERAELIDELRRDGIADEAVLAALGRVPRHRFVPDGMRSHSYGNHPLPIGHGQTISQPYVVAFMTEAARLSPTSNVLEVGTGSGYQAAVLAEMLGLGPGGDADRPHGRLCSIEIIPELAERGDRTLRELGYRDVAVRAGDGYRGWPDRAPFDAILVTAAPGHVPQPLVDQLVVGGRLVIPVGDDIQYLEVLTKTEDGVDRRRVLPVRFVPMTGEAEKKPR